MRIASGKGYKAWWRRWGCCFVEEDDREGEGRFGFPFDF